MATSERNYIYSIGRVRELEKGLLSKVNLDRVLESDDPFAVLRSSAFFKAAEEHETTANLTEMFRREREYNRTQLRELVLGSPVEAIFLLPYDIQNVKLLLKGKLSGNLAVKDAVIEQGTFAKDELIKAIYDEAPSALPVALREDIQTLTQEFQDTRRFALVDARLDRRLRLLQVDAARKVKNKFLIDYLQRLSDMQNITSTIRRKIHLLGRDTLPEVLLATGTLPPSFFERMFDLGWESIAAALHPTEYGTVIENALQQVEQRNFLPLLDGWCASYMIEFLRRAKRYSFGIEPVLAYYLARDHEIRVVRTIVTGKLFNYPLERLRTRLKELYS